MLPFHLWWLFLVIHKELSENMMINDKFLERLDNLIGLMHRAIDEALDSKLKPHELYRQVKAFKADYEIYSDLLKKEVQNKVSNIKQLSEIRKKLKMANILLGQLETELQMLGRRFL